MCIRDRKFVAEETGDVQKVKMEDDHTKVSISKTDITAVSYTHLKVTKLRKFRTAHGYTQIELAAVLGISLRTYQRLSLIHIFPEENSRECP